MLEVAKAGADYVDVAMEPLSWGMVHPDVITIQAMLKDAGFDVPEINMKAYMEARAMTQSFIDDFLGYFINPKNRFLSSLMVGSGLPGGMMGSLMADLKGVHQGINLSLKDSGKDELTEDELLVKLFDEVAFVWPKLGYPPLVTPFSQYVKNVALLNIVQMAKGEERYSMMDDNTWNMILGRAGKLPGPLAPEIIEIANQKGKEFYTGVPQDACPDELDKYRKEMKANGWDTGQDDEELFEFAMHETQFRDYKSGLAKKRFQDELDKMKSQSKQTKTTVAVKEKQAPNRNSYAKNKADDKIAMIGYLLYTANSQFEEKDCCHNKHDVWSSIGLWRNLVPVTIAYNEKEYPMNIRQNKEGFEVEIYNDIFECKIDFIEKGEIDFNVNGTDYFAKIGPGDENLVKVNIGEEDFQMIRNDLLETEMEVHGDESGIADEGNHIISPLPGRVFKVSPNPHNAFPVHNCGR